MLLRCLVALVGGLLLAGAFEPLGYGVLLTVGVAAWIFSVRGLAPSRAWIPGLVFGISFIFAVMVWMRSVGTDAWLAMCAVEAAFFAPLGAVTALLTRMSRAWPLWTALAWTTVEAVRSVWPFSGMPFGQLAFATVETPWAASSAWITTVGTSLLVALSGTVLAWVLVEGRTRRTAAGVAVVGLATLTALPNVITLGVETTDTITVAAVQGDVPGSGTDVVAVYREVTDNHVAATVQLGEDVRGGERAAPDFVVWPENSTAVDPFRDRDVREGIDAASAAVGVPILVGAMADAPSDDHVLNQGIVWDPETGGGDRYTKMHPVPYGEYIPYRNSKVIPSNYGKLRLIPRDMLRGTRADPLIVAGTTVADAICFDVAYNDVIAPQLRAGAQLVTVQTSNAMFVNTGQIAQQFEISRLRAIESGRWVVVAAINGVSGVIRPDGSVAASAGRRQAKVLVEEVELITSLTPATRLGQIPARLIVALTVVHTIFCVVAYRRRRTTRRPGGAADSNASTPIDTRADG